MQAVQCFIGYLAVDTVLCYRAARDRRGKFHQNLRQIFMKEYSALLKGGKKTVVLCWISSHRKSPPDPAGDLTALSSSPSWTKSTERGRESKQAATQKYACPVTVNQKM